MKKQLLLAAVIACALATVTTASAQTALFVYNNGTGTPAAGIYTPGSSFTFSITLAFTSGGAIANLEGLSYWFEQQNPGAPFNFSITDRNVTGSLFTVLQTPGLTYPQNMTPQSTNDLGAALNPMNNGPQGNGTYLIANITVSISPTAANGTYLIENTTTPAGKRSVISDNAGHAFAIPAAFYSITIVPEPGTWAAGSLVFAFLLFTQRSRLARIRRKLST